MSLIHHHFIAINYYLLLTFFSFSIFHFLLSLAKITRSTFCTVHNFDEAKTDLFYGLFLLITLHACLYTDVEIF